MGIRDNLIFVISRSGIILGARPDAAIIFMIFFLAALILCIRVANKNHLFCSSKKGIQKNAEDCEPTE